MQEYRKFAVDNLSHNPDMKLEYLALNQMVDRIVRRIPIKKVSDTKKGKEKSTSPDETAYTSTTVIGSDSSDWTSFTSTNDWNSLTSLANFDPGESSEDDEYGTKSGLRIETVENVRFSEISGVRIFERDVLFGRL